jgi:hypothetical protein
LALIVLHGVVIQISYSRVDVPFTDAQVQELRDKNLPGATWRWIKEPTDDLGPHGYYEADTPFGKVEFDNLKWAAVPGPGHTMYHLMFRLMSTDKLPSL